MFTSTALYVHEIILTTENNHVTKDKGKGIQPSDTSGPLRALHELKTQHLYIR